MYFTNEVQPARKCLKLNAECEWMHWKSFVGQPLICFFIRSSCAQTEIYLPLYPNFKLHVEANDVRNLSRTASESGFIFNKSIKRDQHCVSENFAVSLYFTIGFHLVRAITITPVIVHEPLHVQLEDLLAPPPQISGQLGVTGVRRAVRR